MSSYICKLIGFSVFIYTLLIPSTLMNSFADSHITTDETYIQRSNNKDNMAIKVNESSKKFLNHKANKENNLQNTNTPSESDTTNIISRNIQTVGNILSSSPSDLAEQAKSYALGKFNGTVSSEAQKWLSQFGTARINFGLDKKGTLKENSLDLLLPLYDNKTDWLLFSQLGYRNKDSRNTINVGLGGRYFYQNWMYGLNTFYDHDITGKNQRMGLGGEIWGDYIKLSANTYYRLSDFQTSRNFKDYYERPANGYDINGEFFLPAYPNLGAKLTYEQYFGENVTLFNRDTKQKNPSLAKLGLTYTPIPLVTMGVDYKQGESGHTETQFLVNLIYKLGVPLSTQLSPESVASMRTLAGSRYDLVERNNNIVLDHKEIPKTQLSLPETIVGYSHQQHNISAQISSDTSIKQIHWSTSKDFEENGGKLSSKVGPSIQITLPKFLSGDNKNNNYTIYAFAELNHNQKLEPVEMSVIVRPYEVKTREEANFTPSGPLPADDKSHYTFNPVITFDTVNGIPVKNATIDNVQWISDPAEGDESGLKFSWNKEDSLTTDEKGHLIKTVTLTSKKPTPKGEKVNVYLKMEGEPQQLVGMVSFDEDKSKYYIENNLLNVDQAGPLPTGDNSKYTYTATILDEGRTKVISQEIDDVEWSAKDQDGHGKDVTVTPIKIDGKFKTDENGQLQATLSSLVPLTAVVVSLSIEKHPPVSAHKVSFYPAKIQITSPQKSPRFVHESYDLTVEFLDNSNHETGKIRPVDWKVKSGEAKIKPTGENTATLISLSNQEQTVQVEASIDNWASKSKPFSAEFIWPTITEVALDQANDSVSAGGSYGFTAKVKVRGADGKVNDYTGSHIPFEWSIKSPTNAGLSLSPSGNVTTVLSDGELKATLTSLKDKPTVTDAVVCLTVVGAPLSPTTQKCADPVNFKSPPVDFEITSIEVEIDSSGDPFDQNDPLIGNGTDKYRYKALITEKGSNGTKPIINHTFSSVEWTRTTPNQEQIDHKYLPKPEKISIKTDNKGYLYATLNSYVGVDKVNVTLKIPSELLGDKPKQKDSANLVSFVPVPKQAVMFVYNKYNPNVNTSFTTEYHPANLFSSLIGKLGADTSKPFDENEVYYDEIDDGSGNIYGALTDVGEDHKGPIKFIHPGGTARITAKVIKKDGRIYSYYYRLNIVREIFYPENTIYQENQGYHTPNDNITCESIHSGVPTEIGATISLTQSDFMKSSGKYAINSEFDSLFKWGLFENHSEVIPNDIKYKLAEDRQSNDYVIFDPLTETSTFDSSASGLLVCQLNLNNPN
ncbi:inverse autotransporter beta domain-containing protein [Xenorhabdus bovienii]|uniref:inverse autotransporter beta domain-containing protein n=1 Tax=Xenorhabdus bovienii TaxID=40576 RepID=UPI003DA32325